jgi:hypothetical protein
VSVDAEKNTWERNFSAVLWVEISTVWDFFPKYKTGFCDQFRAVSSLSFDGKETFDTYIIIPQ